MANEFTSAPEARVLEEYDEHGRKRIGTATRIGRTNNWAYEIVHPEGKVGGGTIKHANDFEVSVYLAQAMENKRHDFVTARHRGDKPAYRSNATGSSPAGSPTTFLGALQKG